VFSLVKKKSAQVSLPREWTVAGPDAAPGFITDVILHLPFDLWEGLTGLGTTDNNVFTPLFHEDLKEGVNDHVNKAILTFQTWMDKTGMRAFDQTHYEALKTHFIPKQGRRENNPPWVNDESMNMLVTILNYANAFGRQGVGRTAFLVANPFWVSHAGLSEHRNWFNSAAPFRLHADKDTVLLLPRNYRNSHWSLMVYTPASNSLEVFDSLMEKGEAVAKEDEKLFREFFSSYYGEYHEGTAESFQERMRAIKFTVGHSPRQPDKCSCGLYVFINAMRVMGLWSPTQVLHLTADQRSINALRFRIDEFVNLLMYYMYHSLINEGIPKHGR
jgi:hypothetical protein